MRAYRKGCSTLSLAIIVFEMEDGAISHAASLDCEERIESGGFDKRLLGTIRS